MLSVAPVKNNVKRVTIYKELVKDEAGSGRREVQGATRT